MSSLSVYNPCKIHAWVINQLNSLIQQCFNVYFTTTFISFFEIVVKVYFLNSAPILSVRLALAREIAVELR